MPTSTVVIPSLRQNQVPTPPQGFYSLFYDLDNRNILSFKDYTGASRELNQLPSVDSSALDDCICDITNQIVDDAGCALKKGTINATEHQSITNNINYFSKVTVDPSTGGYSHNLTSSPTLFVSLETTNVLCNGDSTGTATATVMDGDAPYTQTWTDLSGTTVDPAALAAGAYVHTVTDDSGTVRATTFVITEPAALALTVNVQNTSAPGQSDGVASAVVTGGTPLYTYVWNDNLGTPIGQTGQTATGLAAGTYQVVVTDANNCTISDTSVVIS